VIDLGIQRNIGIGEPMAVYMETDVAPFAYGTYSVALATSAAAAITTPTTLATITIGATDVINTKYAAFVPPSQNCQRYLALYATLGGTSPSVTFTSYLLLGKGIQNDQYFTSGFSID
jgi:hypothetical protein